MFFEDARDRTIAATQLLEGLTIQTLDEFLALAQKMKLTRHEKIVIVDQAILLIDQFYAHLPFKRARYAADPVQRLRLLHAQVDHLTDLQFHERMLKAFLQLRDAHTFYSLPSPYRGAFAFLPFEMNRFHEGGHRRFVVTRVLEGFDHPTFGVNSEIVRWNGMPVERAIDLVGEFDPGGNAASRFVRGLNRMSNRPLAYTVPPDESFVVIHYLPRTGGKEQHAIVLPWHVAMETLPQKRRHGATSSISDSTADAAHMAQILWKKEITGPFEHRVGLEGKFGYIRIRTFETSASHDFVNEFGALLDLMQQEAPSGLILDVRSNPGGAIDAAERILQFLTPASIRPVNFHFVNSRLTQQVAASVKQQSGKSALGDHQREWLPWLEDLLDSVSSGSALTPGRPLTNPDDANDTGQRYQGPVVLIVDALAYSATDIFAAGFQDHQIGKIIGVDESTGGGGANRWLHEELRVKLEHVPTIALQKLPGGAQMGLAIRRTTRVGVNAGDPIEDVGVARDVSYLLTRDDALHGHCDLLKFACKQLADQQTTRLKIVKAEMRDGAIELTLEAQNLFRVECQVNGLTQGSFAANAAQPWMVSTAGLLDEPAFLRVNGFARVGDAELQLVAADGVQLT